MTRPTGPPIGFWFSLFEFFFFKCCACFFQIGFQKLQPIELSGQRDLMGWRVNSTALLRPFRVTFQAFEAFRVVI